MLPKLCSHVRSTIIQQLIFLPSSNGLPCGSEEGKKSYKCRRHPECGFNPGVEGSYATHSVFLRNPMNQRNLAAQSMG